MDYTYEFVAIEPSKLYVQVKYSKEGYEDVVRKLGAYEFTPEALTLTAEHGAHEAISIWTAVDNVPAVIEVPTGPISATYSESKAPEMQEIFNPCPEYDHFEFHAEEVMNQRSDILLEWDWVITPLTEEGKAEVFNRGVEIGRWERNSRLAQTDHWMVDDTPNPTAEQLAYRQALRDVPSQAGFPKQIEWPTLPEA